MAKQNAYAEYFIILTTAYFVFA